MKLQYRVGVTGGIGSGKSYICKILENMGYPVFYADKVSKTLLANDPSIILKIKNLVGEEAYLPDGKINKGHIAKEIFSNAEKLEAMNAIMHPAVRNEFSKWADAQNSSIVFNEAAILFETGSYKHFDKTILVVAPESVRIERILLREDTSVSQIKSRMANQWEDSKKRPLTNYIITNDGVKMLLPQIDHIIKDILNQSSAN